MNWFDQWFNEHYLDLYSGRDETDARQQIDLITKEIPLQPEMRILDVGCGMGRHVAIWHKLGYFVTGVDISKTLIDLGKKHYPHLSLLHSSLENLSPQEKSYGLLLSLFTGFGYYEEDADNQKFLQQISNLLIPGGWFWLDYFQTKYLLQQPLLDHITKITRNDKVKYFREERRIETYTDQNNPTSPPHKRVVKYITLLDGHKKGLESFRESVRIYSEEEIRRMLSSAGLEVQKTFGDYMGSSLHSNNPRAIFLAQKKSLS